MLTLSAMPLASHLELGALPTAVACARLHARHVACEQGFADLADTVELLTSELITNAVRASRSLPCPAVVRLEIACDKTSFVIGVWDGSDEMPVRRDATPDDDSGRGLLLVDTLSADWGVRRTTPGKIVWARLSR